MRKKIKQTKCITCTVSVNVILDRLRFVFDGFAERGHK